MSGTFDSPGRHLARCRFCLSVPVMVLAVALVGLCGCAVAPLEDRSGTTPAIRGVPAASFALAGRISVRVDERIDSGQIRWERDAARDSERIALFTPLGSQVAELTREGSRAEFRRGNETRQGDFAALTESLVGAALDLAAIAGWLQGAGLDSQGRGRAASSDGRQWEIEADGLAWRGSAWIARRLTIQSGGTVVKLVVDEWEAR